MVATVYVLRRVSFQVSVAPGLLPLSCNTEPTCILDIKSTFLGEAASKLGSSLPTTAWRSISSLRPGGRTSGSETPLGT